MIHSSFLRAAPTRRIAVIGIPRPQPARLGRLGIIRNASIDPINGPEAWTTISDQVPDSADNFMSSVIQSQNAAVLQTPGTLTYTPASNTPPQNVAPWNSWLQPNCYPDPTGTSVAADGSTPAAAGNSPTAMAATSSLSSPTATSPSPLWWIVGLLGAAASATYLYETATRRR